MSETTAPGDLDTRTDPPVNRFGQRLNDDYLAPACEDGGEHGCYSNACCCTCHQENDAELIAEARSWMVEWVGAYDDDSSREVSALLGRLADALESVGWEYGALTPDRLGIDVMVDDGTIPVLSPPEQIYRRRKAGPWMGVKSDE